MSMNTECGEVRPGRVDPVPGIVISDAARNERGVALPLALFGLVAISLLVTTALLTSSTELALSRAHQDGTRGLYAADAALEQFVGQRAFALPDNERLVPGTHAQQASGGNFGITVAEMARGPTLTDGDLVWRTETYSLLAQPSGRWGRSVGAFLEIVRQTGVFSVDVAAGLTVGGSVTVGGNSTISDGRNTDCDDPGKQADNALQVSAGSTITKQGAAALIEGKADTASFTKQEMVDLILGGMSLSEAAQQVATLRFAAGQLASRKPSSLTAGGQPRLRSDSLNWGCPVASNNSCKSVAGNQSNLEYFPIIALNAGGGEITLNGDHAQGIIIVHNGSLRVAGNFVFNGILLVEKDLIVVGGQGGDGVKLEGAVVALGEESEITDNVSGNAVITFNRCVVDLAKAAATEARLETAPQLFTTPTFAWYEVVR